MYITDVLISFFLYLLKKCLIVHSTTMRTCAFGSYSFAAVAANEGGPLLRVDAAARAVAHLAGVECSAHLAGRVLHGQYFHLHAVHFDRKEAGLI